MNIFGSVLLDKFRKRVYFVDNGFNQLEVVNFNTLSRDILPFSWYLSKNISFLAGAFCLTWMSVRKFQVSSQIISFNWIQSDLLFLLPSNSYRLLSSQNIYKIMKTSTILSQILYFLLNAPCIPSRLICAPSLTCLLSSCPS